MTLKEQIFGIEPVIGRGQKYEPLQYEDIYKVIETVMKLDPSEDLEGIQFHSPNPRRIDVMTKGSWVWYDKDLFSFMNESYEIENGKTILITRPYEDYTLVRVKRIPLWWEEDVVKRIFNFYGDVKSITSEVIRNSRVRDDYHGIRSGNWTLKMTLKKHMPSALSVSGERFEIYYDGQQPTCWRCGMAHQKHECRTKYDKFINRFSIQEFPELPLPHVVEPIVEEVAVTSAAPVTTPAAAPVTTPAAASVTISAAPVNTPAAAPVTTIASAATVTTIVSAATVTTIASAAPVNTPAAAPVNTPAATVTTSASAAPVTTSAPVTPPAPVTTSVSVTSSGIVTQSVIVQPESISLNTTMDTFEDASEVSDSDMNVDQSSVTKSSGPEMSSQVTTVKSGEIGSNSGESSSSLVGGSLASVTTVDSLSGAPRSSVLISVAQDSQGASDSSEGFGTIGTAWDDYVSPSRDIVEVHHSENSQLVASETTLTASEVEEDHLITPAQRQNEEVVFSSDQPREEDAMTIEVDSAQYEQLFKDEGKRSLGSSDEDNSVNNIIMNIGSFVNSFNPLGASASKDKKRTKLERSQSQTDLMDI